MAISSDPSLTSSMARSQINAALPTQEWRNYANANSKLNSKIASNAIQRVNRHDVDNEDQSREKFFEELRERHRMLTQRQREAKELYFGQDEQTTTSDMANGYNQKKAAKRQKITSLQRTPHQLTLPAETAARRYRPSTFPPLRFDILRHRDQDRTDRLRPGPAGSDSGFARGTSPIERQQTAPSMIEDLDVEDENKVLSGQKKQKKRVRYLRDTDRHNIIKRIENGEKQAALAREFGVTRAAICHIKKNRNETLSRYNMLVKSAQEMDRADTFVEPPGVETMVHQVRADSVLLLMTKLRDHRSNSATFRRVAGRLIMILLEEALVIMGTDSVEVMTGTGHLYRGLELKHQLCGVAIGAEGFPFLVLFHQMEPEAPQGSIHVAMGTDRRGQPAWRLDHMDLPANIVQHKVLLFSSTCSTGEAECKAIEVLCSVGCDERNISLVVILVASEGIIAVSSRFPQVKIIYGGSDANVDPRTSFIIPGFGDFVSRYNG